MPKNRTTITPLPRKERDPHGPERATLERDQFRRFEDLARELLKVPKSTITKRKRGK